MTSPASAPKDWTPEWTELDELRVQGFAGMIPAYPHEDEPAAMTFAREILRQREEIERLARREREALDAHNASFSALSRISFATDLHGEVDEYSAVADAVERELASLRALLSEKDEDAAMLDLLEDLNIDAAGKWYVVGPDDRGSFLRIEASGGCDVRTILRAALVGRSPETPAGTPRGESNAE